MNWSIEGNIGAGKSTLGQALKNKYPKVYNLIPEPVKVWMDTGMLQSYYSDKKRWAYTFQNFALVTRLISWRKNKKLGMINLNDRSVFGDKEVFAKMLMHDGFMEPLEMAVYQEYHNLITEEDVPTLFIYVRTPVETCAERVKERNRTAEDSIPLDYLQKVHDLHEQWIATLPKDRVLILDGTKTTEELVEEVHALFN